MTGKVKTPKEIREDNALPTYPLDIAIGYGLAINNRVLCNRTLGKLLTIMEAAMSESSQLQALKQLIRVELYGLTDDIQEQIYTFGDCLRKEVGISNEDLQRAENLMADYHNLGNPVSIEPH